MLGNNSVFMMLIVVICFPIHSIVVVTSPMGVHAPPAFAAITIMPAKNKRMSLFGISFLVNDTSTIVVVRLSSIAERKNAIQQTIQSRAFGFLVRILSVIM